LGKIALAEVPHFFPRHPHSALVLENRRRRAPIVSKILKKKPLNVDIFPEEA